MEKIECCNIWIKKCFLELKNGEKICPWCNGHGAIFTCAHFKEKVFILKACELCKGIGKVDWILFITRSLGHRLMHNTKIIPMKCGLNKKCKKLKKLFLDQNYKEGMQKWMKD